MNISIGIVGLPNVGKSTLFNALTKLQVTAANYPFATIEPNLGVVPVKDTRIDKLAELSKSQDKVYPNIEFVDIAGLVRGASTGEGLGNQFLGHIKQVAAIAQTVRLFSNTDITHVEDNVDPKRDIEIINSELILKDLETIQKAIEQIKKIAEQGKDLELKKRYETYLKSYKLLNSGNLLYKKLTNDELEQMYDLHLITVKKFIYIANVDETEIRKPQNFFQEQMGLSEDDFILPLNIKLEEELSAFTDEEATEYLESVGEEYTGLQKLIRRAFETLDLITFFTTGEKETRAWTIQKGTNAKDAAGVIHTDFSKNFISLEVIKYNDFIQHGSFQACKENGLVKLQGRDYIVEDGDVVIVKHN